ncbi:IS3 family transposase [Candidatus Paracaedibacter symbiosus]|uniref:IS3 family transposase n=1 Tax=Candidatus Paracaedibacter symbiosus TaxID=244582 RepID=UPI00094E0400
MSFSKVHTPKRAQENAHLLQHIKTAHESSRGTYGSLRIQAVLKFQGNLWWSPIIGQFSSKIRLHFKFFWQNFFLSDQLFL